MTQEMEYFREFLYTEILQWFNGTCYKHLWVCVSQRRFIRQTNLL